jgi:exodeoxyribonuclease VII large subunit
MRSCEQRQQTLLSRLHRNDPRRGLLSLQEDSEQLRKRLQLAWQSQLLRQERELERRRLRLQGLDPRAILERGYAIARDQNGKVIREASDVAPGSEIETILWRGSLRSRVTACED